MQWSYGRHHITLYKEALIVKQASIGDPTDDVNPFVWNRIELNLPGTDNYDASKPWIQKVREDGK